MITNGFAYIAAVAAIPAVVCWLEAKTTWKIWKWLPAFVFVYLLNMIFCTFNLWDLEATSSAYSAVKGNLQYALMLDRASISKVNGFIEADGTIRLYFTVEQAQKKLHRSRQCVTRIFRELEYSGLICRKKQGLGKPALITLNYPSNAKLIRPKEAGENLSG